MENRWNIEFAKEFKQRDNIDYIGAIIGKVVSVDPIKISILNDKALLDASKLYICSSLKKGYSINATIDTPQYSGTGTIVKNEGLKNGDRVMLITIENNQKFFVIDRIGD